MITKQQLIHVLSAVPDDTEVSAEYVTEDIYPCTFQCIVAGVILTLDDNGNICGILSIEEKPKNMIKNKEAVA